MPQDHRTSKEDFPLAAGQSHQLTRVPWVYQSYVYSVTDSFHCITSELG